MMRRLVFTSFLWTLWMPSTVVADNAQLQISRELTQQFGAELRATLLGAMESGGAIEAMNVCRDAAPVIAARLSRQSGARVGRTSRRYRNPLNAPEPWQRVVLTELFEPAVQDTPNRIEYFAEGGADVRYMQVIRLGPLCATCHGSELSVPVQSFLDRNYPHDQARGYEPGDMRGAFSVVWPARF